jgi:hypothetical protein
MALAWVVALAVAALYVVNAAVHGALGAARNDDWVYYRLAFEFFRTGHLEVDPYTSTLLVGQIVAAQPVIAVFGESVAALQIAVALLSAVTLASSYLFLRHFLPVTWAVASVACLAVGPLWGGLSVSFMSEVPALALQVLALCAAVPALRGPRLRWGWLVWSLALSLAAFSVREYALAAPAAILLTAYRVHGPGGAPWRRRDDPQVRRVLLGLVAAGLVWCAAAAALVVWRGTLVTEPRALSAQIELGQRVAYVTVGLLTTTGFMLFPVALAVWRGGGWRRLRRWWPLPVALVVGFTLTAHVLRYPLLLGNYLRLGGSYSGTLAGSAPRVFSEQVWWCIMAVANVSTALLLTFAVVHATDLLRRRSRTLSPDSLAAEEPVGPRRQRGIDPAPRLALVFGVAGVALTIVVCLITHARPLDRYVIGSIPFLAAAGLHVSRSRRPQRAGTIVSAVGLVLLAAVGVTQVDASATFDGAKWSLGEQAVRAGYTAETVDAGYEWFGLHQPTPVIYDPRRELGYSSWVTTLFQDARVCVNGQFAPRPTHREPYPGEVVRVRRTTLTGLDYTLIGRSTDRNCSNP